MPQQIFLLPFNLNDGLAGYKIGGSQSLTLSTGRHYSFILLLLGGLMSNFHSFIVFLPYLFRVFVVVGCSTISPWYIYISVQIDYYLSYLVLCIWRPIYSFVLENLQELFLQVTPTIISSFLLLDLLWSIHWYVFIHSLGSLNHMFLLLMSESPCCLLVGSVPPFCLLIHWFPLWLVSSLEFIPFIESCLCVPF